MTSLFNVNIVIGIYLDLNILYIKIFISAERRAHITSSNSDLVTQFSLRKGIYNKAIFFKKKDNRKSIITS